MEVEETFIQRRNSYNGSLHRDSSKWAHFFITIRKYKKSIVKGFTLIAILVYVAYAISIRFGDEDSVRLLMCTVVGLLFLAWRQIIRRYPEIFKFRKSIKVLHDRRFRRIIRWILYIVVGIGAAIYTIVYSLIDHPENLVSLGGIAFFLIVTYATSTNRAKVNWHTLYWGILIQLLFGILFVSSEFGVTVMTYVSQRFSELTSYSDSGAIYVFGPRYSEFRMIFQTMPRILFFITLINVLQYLGTISFLMRTFGSFLAYCLGTKPVESFVAVTNIIMGSSEAFMSVSPYLDGISKSELFALLVCGMASAAGDALIFYKSFGAPMIHLLTASIMSAPAALVCAKMNMPEETVKKEKAENSKNDNDADMKTDTLDIRCTKMSDSRNILEALTKGAEMGTKVVTTIVISMLVYISLIEFLNMTVGWLGDRIDVNELTFEKILSYLLWPIAFIIGIPSSDCLIIGRFLGIRGFISVSLSYLQMGQFIENKKQLSSYEAKYNDTVFLSNRDIFLPMWNTTLTEGVLEDRTEVIGTFALCGFSCLPVLGMTLGIFATIAPKRLIDITEIIFRAFVISNFASLLTSCVAGKPC
ncbi:hypothetical protein FSP39_007010 [Pinctada imbricata]|uniref:Uncharacterized protein n=1 Tax=Pinctada imbricata TaxID=66713 RepID=A0AA89C0Z0_PINIB|nr:hypothetical protein FSP39_007010 [Pinctada imbricata]